MNNKMTYPESIKVIVFDADDTLWDCQSHFDLVEKQYHEMFSEYGSPSDLHDRFFAVECGNMEELGYGSKAFTLSLIENAISLTEGTITGTELLKIEQLGRSLLRLPATPLPGVEETLSHIKRQNRFRMVLFTKGDNLEQESKLNRSGLSSFFDDVIIVSNKSSREYLQLCEWFRIHPDEMLMVGNSFKSDIAPALEIGAYAVHIPFYLTWQHEQAEEYAHDRLTTIDHFSELSELLS